MNAYQLNEQLELWMIDNWDKDPRYKCPVPIKWPKLGIPTVYVDTNGSIRPLHVGPYRRRRANISRRPWSTPVKDDFIYPEDVESTYQRHWLDRVTMF